jgi:E3 ubiquitin-protein ligase UBR4
VLAKLLTALAQHSSTAQLGLTKHFAPALDLQALDEAAAAAGGAGTTAGAAAVSTADTTQADAATAAAQGEQGAEAAAEGSGEEEEEEPLLAAVHAEAGGAMSVHEHCLQLKAFLRLIEALSNSPTAPSSSSTTMAAAAPAAAGQEQHAAGSTAAVTDFKQLVLEQGVPGRLAEYLLAAFTSAQDSGSSSGADALLQPGTPAWAAAAARPGVPFALQLLTALAQGHAPTAAGLAAQQPLLLQLLHLLEGTAGGSTITPLAEACLEALARAGAAGVAGRIADLRAATAAEMKARAARKRAALLASMGMVQVEAAAAAGGGVKIVPSPGAVPALSPLAAELAALEGGVPDDDEGGNVCMVCREGYGLQPTTLLGCYCFCMVAAAAEWPGCGPPWGTPHDLLLTTVSHFNLIHTQCHAAAKAADASLRQPKREWQGATLRNGNVLCNSLLPLAAPAGGKVETAYAAAVTSFWQQQLSAPSAREAAAAAGSSGGTGGGSGGGSGADAAAVAVAVSLSRRSSALREADSSLLRVSLVAADLATLLWRFSAQLSFSEEARGGGRASNARLLFALLQLGRYYVVEAPTSELRQAHKLLATAGGAAAALGLEAAAAAAVTVPGAGAGGGGSSAAGSSTAAAACSADDLSELSSHAPFVLALSLLCMGPAEWMAARRSMLVLAARAGAGRAQQPQGAGGDSTGGSSHRRSSSGASPAAAAAGAAAASAALSDEALYTAAAPMLRLFGFVDWLHQWGKPAVGSGSGSGGSSGSGGWGGAMAQQLADLTGCAQAAGELLEVADEAEEAFGLQDLLDGFGCLGVALGPKSATVEEFLRVACT